MKKLTSIIYLCMVLLQIKIIESEVMIGMPGDENNECSNVAKDVIEENKNTKILSPHSIVGKWVSEKCESRPGPKFMFRSYSFFSNQTFYLMQFFYNDESCSSVSYTVTMEGRYTLPKQKRRSSPSFAAHIEITLQEAIVIALDQPTATGLAKDLNEKCPGLTKRYWKPFQEYVLFTTNDRKSNDFGTTTNEFRSDGTEIQTQRVRKNAPVVKYDRGCPAVIDLSLNELNTIRIQSRDTKKFGLRYELLLANTYYTDQNWKNLRHKFQSPLILVNGSTECQICNAVAESKPMHVPPLTAKAKLPLYANGEWISDRCEALSTGLFSMRILRLRDQTHTWEQQTSYYADYICSNLTMEHRAFGNFVASRVAKRVPGAVDVDFFIEKSSLTIFEEGTLEKIRADQRCGVPHNWQLGETNDIPPLTGCTTVNIFHEPKNFDIARLEVDENGTYLLFMGDEDSTANRISRRPTAYKYPLVRCSRYVDEFQPDSAHTITMSPTLLCTLVIVSVFHGLLAVLQ